MRSRDIHERGHDEDIHVWDESSCPECDGNLRVEDGELACFDCGLIVSEYRIDHTSTRVNYRDSEVEREQTGAPLTPALHDRGLSTDIGKLRDGKGNLLPPATRRRLDRLQTHHSRAKWKSKADRNLGRGLGEIARICGALDLSRTVQLRACEIFREAQRERLLHGRSVEGIAAASVFGAIRCLGHTRTPEEVVEVARTSEASVVKGYRVLNVELGLQTGIVHPRDFIPRIASACDVPEEVRTRAIELVAIAEAQGIGNGRKPSAVAAAALYLAADELGWPLVQTEVAEAGNTTPVTVRKRYYELLDATEAD